MRIAIIGKGTASIITAMVMLQRGHEIDIYYDPQTSHINVGESTTPQFASLIYDTLGLTIHDLCDQNITSIKGGIKFIDWGDNQSFKHNFGYNTFAFHFENKKLNPFLHQVLEERGVTYFPEKVTEENVKIYNFENLAYINDRPYDFIVFCSGWNQQKSGYVKPFFETVNTAILYTENSVDEDFLHTIHRATEDGWQFGLPFPKDKVTKCGYLFNRNISDPEQVKEKLKNHNVYETLNWTPRYSRNLLENRLISYNGNSLFFIEPLQALTLFYTINFAMMTADYLNTRDDRSFSETNYNYRNNLYTYLLSIAYHYSYGSKYSSEFWKIKKEEAKKSLFNYQNGDEETFLENLVNDITNNYQTDYSKIGCFLLAI
jgi:hypothetical protein